jgi:hypothetical protein
VYFRHTPKTPYFNTPTYKKVVLVIVNWISFVIDYCGGRELFLKMLKMQCDEIGRLGDVREEFSVNQVPQFLSDSIYEE